MPGMQTDFPQTPDPAESLVRFCEGKSASEDASAIERLMWEQLRRLIARLAAAIADLRAAAVSPQDNVPEPEPEPRRRAPVTSTPAPPLSLLQRGWGWLRRQMPGQAEDWDSGPQIGGPAVADARISPCGDPGALSCPPAMTGADDPAPPALGSLRREPSVSPVSEQAVFGVSRPSPQSSPEGEGATQTSPLSRVREREGVRAAVQTALPRQSPARQRMRCAGLCFPRLADLRRAADPPANFFQSA